MSDDPEHGYAAVFCIPCLFLLIDLLRQKYGNQQQMQLCRVWPTYYKFYAAISR